MGHVHQERSLHLARHLGESRKVDVPRVGTSTRDDELGALGARDIADLVEVDQARGFVHPVLHGAEQSTAGIHVRPVREMAAVRELESHQRFPGLHDGEVRRHVRLGSAVGLHVGVVGPEQLEGAVDGVLFDLVHDLAATVVPLTRVALRVLVREDRTHGLQHRPGHEVLARNELEPVLLAGRLTLDQRVNRRIGCFQRPHPVVCVTHGLLRVQTFFFAVASTIRSSASRSAARYVGMFSSLAIWITLRIVS
jgi:hypothetical protein